MKDKRQVALVAFVICGAAGLVVTASQKSVSYVPPNGFVPDETTATRIAEAVWIPIWGEQSVSGEKPFVATLNGDVWTVRGTLKAGPGGVAEAEISKRDGRILRVAHGQ